MTDKDKHQFRPDQAESTPERYEANWSQATVVDIHVPDEHHRVRRECSIDQGHLETIREAVAVAITEGKLTKWNEPNMRNLQAQLTTYGDSLLRPREAWEQRPLSERLPSSVQLEHLNIHTGAAQPESVIELLSRTERPDILFTSNSHRPTIDILVAAKRLVGDDLSERTAVLSFDHHSDMQLYPYGTGVVVDKASVLSYVHYSNIVKAVAAIGVSPKDMGLAQRYQSEVDRPLATAIPGLALYDYKTQRPNRKLFITAMDRLCQMWQEAGVTQVYPTVDLDGLRLREQAMTATDYNPVDNLRTILSEYDLWKLAHDVLITTGDERAAAIVKLANSVSSVYAYAISGPDYAVPSSWVGRALEIAKFKYGFGIGVPVGEQRLVGDVNEYTGGDFRGNTAAVATGILNGLLRVAQNDQPRGGWHLN